MKNKLILFFFSMLYLSVQAQIGTSSDSIAQRDLFLNLKSEFKEYEKKHGNYIQTNNVNMHYLEWGDKKNPTLVWIHGTYSNGYELYEIIDQLINMNLHIIAIDYYGHGFTPISSKDLSI
ncbi:alpha/beta hydrolase [Myroides sp. M-43]|uniref:alpha/beta fold hydrolase n=1 Tax=Myroides oncorhynchi TaxID=2893756 RepID=UPI001E2C5758|nr:alpha/beta hydrolase [Myroides oncorhynchi]MCC9043810.1 alpha/beta hydrolase [Myroides oncorhynchi]